MGKRKVWGKIIYLFLLLTNFIFRIFFIKDICVFLCFVWEFYDTNIEGGNGSISNKIVRKRKQSCSCNTTIQR